MMEIRSTRRNEPLEKKVVFNRIKRNSTFQFHHKVWCFPRYNNIGKDATSMTIEGIDSFTEFYAI